MSPPVVYLDANADEPVLPAALAAYRRVAAVWGNPSSAHAAGDLARQELAASRAAIAAALAAHPDEIVLTSGGTESAALAILGVLGGGTPGSRDGGRAGSAPPHVVSTSIEHPAVRHTLQRLAASGRITSTVVAVPRHGRVEAAAVLAAVLPATRLVSVVAACNETGVLQPVAEVAAGLRGHGALLHTDAVQLAGRLPVTPAELGVDLFGISGHKVGAVGGCGALWVRRGVALSPVLLGGGQEDGRQSTTENVAGAASLAAALAERPEVAEAGRMAGRRDRLELAIGQGAAALGVEVSVIGASAPRLPNTACLRLHGIAGEALMMALDLERIEISTGSACSSGSVDPSPILLGMGLSAAEARQTVRYSLPRGCAEPELERAAAVTVEVLRRITSSSGSP